ncbi:MAG TPA: type II toxin-antitoxin system RelE/ParE family toxin [Orrella sp.]
MSVVWKVLLADQAELDLLEITIWTAENFGRRQADVYAETITLAIEALHNGPDILGVDEREEIGPDIRTLHVARNGRKGRHFVVFRGAPRQTIEVLRLLHDSMDLAQHVPPDNESQH